VGRGCWALLGSVMSRGEPDGLVVGDQHGWGVKCGAKSPFGGGSEAWAGLWGLMCHKAVG